MCVLTPHATADLLNKLSVPFVVKRDQLVATIPDLPRSFTVSVEITPSGDLVDDWGEILRFTTTNNNCCNSGDRIFGIWFSPGTRQLTLAVTKRVTGQWWHPGFTADLLVGQPAVVQVHIGPSEIAAYVDGVRLVHEDGIGGDIAGPTSDVMVYASSGWEKDSAAVTLRNLVVTESGTSSEPTTGQHQTMGCWKFSPARTPAWPTRLPGCLACPATAPPALPQPYLPGYSPDCPS